ncbi:MAG TPA: ATP-grasp domain-containing protein [Thermoanaerobaculia bacterium]|nr:ATP-grasp domain-containing protein [Thermoanaerobaculia bacterium]
MRKAIDELRRHKPDLVFNLCEGVQGNPRWEMHFALALEMLGIPFTGCDPVATGICGDKWMTKQLLNVAAIPTPRGFLVTEPRLQPRLAPAETGAPFGTWIVKPSREDAGIGIDASSVCSTEDQITSRCAEVIETYRQPALVEEFIDGRELNQALFYGGEGIVVLPPGEIVFSQQLTPRERVVGWKAKWASGSAEDRATSNRTPAVIDDTLRRDMANMCTRAANVLSLHGYCRFDIRQRPTGELCIIDINPSPDIGQNTGFRKALDAAGIAFSDFLQQLMIAALASRG